jgi:hypothetical protein
MQRLAFALALLACGLVASSPARADYAVIQFGDGRCQVWWDSAGDPWGAGWTKIAIGLPDFTAAQATLEGAFTRGLCR